MSAVDALVEWIDAAEAQGVRVKRIRLRVEQMAMLYDDLMKLYDRVPLGDERGLLFMGVSVYAPSAVRRAKR